MEDNLYTPVEPKRLRVSGGREFDYNNEPYKINSIHYSKRKNKKYVGQLQNLNTNDTYNIHFGDKRYQDWYQHRDIKRRNNFKTRHAGILLKDGRKAIEDPRQPAWWSYNVNWSYMCSTVNFGGIHAS